MPDILKDLHIDLIVSGVRASSLRQALRISLEDLSLSPKKDGAIDVAFIFEQLMERETHVSSAIGGGLAMPNMIIDEIESPVSVLALLEKPLIYKTPDNIPVDMLCVVLSPDRMATKHLTRLSRLARFLKDPATRTNLQGSNDPRSAMELMLLPAGMTHLAA